MKRSVFLLAALAASLAPLLAHAADRSAFDAYASAAPFVSPQIAVSSAPPAVIASMDAQRSVPALLWETRQLGAARPAHPATTEAAARAHLARHAARYGLSADALSTAGVVQIHDTGRGGIIVVLRQRIGGIEVFRHDVKIMMDRSLDLVAIGGNLHPDGVPNPKNAFFALSDAEALASAFGDLYGVGATVSDFQPAPSSRAPYRHFDLVVGAAAEAAQVSFLGDARVKRVFYPLPDRIVPAWFVELDAGDATTRQGDAFAYVISADDGSVLHRENLKHDDAFTYRVWADTTSGDFRPTDGPLLDFTPHPTGVPDGSYPGPADPILVTMSGFNHNPQGTFDPWLASGATKSKGNNVDAYTDDDKPDGFSKNDLRATVTAPGVFDRIYDLSLKPQASADQRMASVTQLFYLTNWLHDWWYDSGFDEAAGNAQEDNFGRGGVDGDPVHAQAQDGAPKTRNNSNMSAFYDGKSPRMQMYVWDGKTDYSLDLGVLGSSFVLGDASFGPKSFDVTAEAVIAKYGSPAMTDGCSPITNDVTGKIAVIDRGTCDFKQKVVNAEAAGAVGALILDNVQEIAPLFLGSGSPASTKVNIASLGMEKDDGHALKTAIAAGPVTATMHRVTDVDRDGGLDNSIAAHEWGHYLHLRQVNCGNQACGGMSEGFADFDAILMVMHDGDDPSRVYPLAQYATAADPDDPGYFGIRRYPYSTDKTKNPLTYGLIANGVPLPKGVPVSKELLGIPNSEVHNIGEVWAQMLFEAYASLLLRHPYATAHRRMTDYVEAGFKLAPTDPTLLEQRDAILAAARAADPSDFDSMAAAFAKRGAGACALSPPRESTTMIGAVESFDVLGAPLLDELNLTDDVHSCDHDGILDVGETGTLSVRVTNTGWADVDVAEVEFYAPTAALRFPNGPRVDVPKLAPNESTTVKVEVEMAPVVTHMDPAVITARVVANPANCEFAPLEVAFPLNLDEVPNDSTYDGVEARTSPWKISGKNADGVFSRFQRPDGNHVWQGVDLGSPSDASLTSPTLEVSKTEKLQMTFFERHSFEESLNTNWDGAVIEFSTDGGATFKDVSEVSNIVYEGKIGKPKSMDAQPLVGRQGYVGKNAEWPAFGKRVVDFGDKLAGKSVKIRFRIASDYSTGAPGWMIDGIEFAGIDNHPFTALVDNRRVCGDSGSGGGGEGGGASHVGPDTPLGCGCRTAGSGSEGPYWLAGLAAAFATWRRRARRTSPRRGG